jgi:hypothetical protein
MSFYTIFKKVGDTEQVFKIIESEVDPVLPDDSGFSFKMEGSEHPQKGLVRPVFEGVGDMGQWREGATVDDAVSIVLSRLEKVIQIERDKGFEWDGEVFGLSEKDQSNLVALNTGKLDIRLAQLAGDSEAENQAWQILKFNVGEDNKKLYPRKDGRPYELSRDDLFTFLGVAYSTVDTLETLTMTAKAKIDFIVHNNEDVYGYSLGSQDVVDYLLNLDVQELL